MTGYNNVIKREQSREPTEPTGYISPIRSNLTDVYLTNITSDTKTCPLSAILSKLMTTATPTNDIVLTSLG